MGEVVLDGVDGRFRGNAPTGLTAGAAEALGETVDGGEVLDPGESAVEAPRMGQGEGALAEEVGVGQRGQRECLSQHWSWSPKRIVAIYEPTTAHSDESGQSGRNGATTEEGIHCYSRSAVGSSR